MLVLWLVPPGEWFDLAEDWVVRLAYQEERVSNRAFGKEESHTLHHAGLGLKFRSLEKASFQNVHVVINTENEITTQFLEM